MVAKVVYQHDMIFQNVYGNLTTVTSLTAVDGTYPFQHSHDVNDSWPEEFAFMGSRDDVTIVTNKRDEEGFIIEAFGTINTINGAKGDEPLLIAHHIKFQWYVATWTDTMTPFGVFAGH